MRIKAQKNQSMIARAGAVLYRHYGDCLDADSRAARYLPGNLPRDQFVSSLGTRPSSGSDSECGSDTESDSDTGSSSDSECGSDHNTPELQKRLFDVTGSGYSDTGMPVAELLKSKSDTLKSVKHKSFYTAIGKLVRYYRDVLKKNKMSIDFNPESILYVLTPKNGISFSTIDFGPHPPDKSRDERNSNFHHHQLRNLSPLNPPATYFFEVIVHLYMDNLLDGKRGRDRVDTVWRDRHIKRKLTPRPNIQSLFEKLENCYATIMTDTELHIIWSKTRAAVGKIWQSQMTNEICANPKKYSNIQCSGPYGQCVLYDTIYTRFCAEYYDTKLPNLNGMRNDVRLHHDRYALGVVVLELMKARGLSDGNRSERAEKWVKKLMIGRETLEKVYQGFQSAASKSIDKKPTELDTSPCPLADVSYKIRNQSAMSVHHHGTPGAIPNLRR